MPGRIHRDAVRSIELPVAGTAIAPLGDEVAARVELLDAMVVGVGDVEVAADVDGDAARIVELPVPVAGILPPLIEKGPGVGELLDTLVGPVGHIDLTGAVDSDVVGRVESSVLDAAGAAPTADAQAGDA